MIGVSTRKEISSSGVSYGLEFSVPWDYFYTDKLPLTCKECLEGHRSICKEEKKVDTVPDRCPLRSSKFIDFIVGHISEVSSI